MIKKMKIFAVVLIFLVFSINAFAAQINSTGYKQNVVVSVGGQNSSSASYKTNIAVGIINGIINSTSFISKLGFFHFLLLAGNQPCTANSQCEGGFCCSSLCSSSACSTGGTTTGGGGSSAAPSSAGGGGGTPVVETPKTVNDFSVTPSSIQEQIPLGASKTSAIIIRNTGSTQLDFALSISTINDFVSLSSSGFSLGPGQEKSLDINIIGKQLGSYFGEIRVAAAGIEKAVTIVLDIQSTQVLFDVKIDIPSAYKEVEPGEDLKTQITLFNVGSGKKVDVTPTYIIKDKGGSVVYESSETFAVEVQKSYTKTIRMPKDLNPGDYLAIVELRYENSFAVSSELFKIVQKKPEAVSIPALNTSITFVFIIFAGLLSLFVYLLAPRLKFAGSKLGKCNKIIIEMQKAVDNDNTPKAEELYIEVKKLYPGLGDEDKKIVYGKLRSLYRKLKK